eukprot:CAMPEP_0174853418 /NCGR_PEP_ID=MMETSP1114-20130205/28384_1 /TAXON_ID=312471 /ORGANISM="Neobodo designis, Strain CCAP 1951/1" /LENGTH=245 /DNA_ID=CAMNT_0016088063 /DNA_START=38 /DNA_END=776 /DNA_ORIENTATION=+
MGSSCSSEEHAQSERLRRDVAAPRSRGRRESLAEPPAAIRSEVANRDVCASPLELPGPVPAADGTALFLPSDSPEVVRQFCNGAAGPRWRAATAKKMSAPSRQATTSHLAEVSTPCARALPGTHRRRRRPRGQRLSTNKATSTHPRPTPPSIPDSDVSAPQRPSALSKARFCRRPAARRLRPVDTNNTHFAGSRLVTAPGRRGPVPAKVRQLDRRCGCRPAGTASRLRAAFSARRRQTRTPAPLL